MQDGPTGFNAVRDRISRCHLSPDGCAAAAVRADSVHVWQSGDVCSVCIDRIIVRLQSACFRSPVTIRGRVRV